VGDRFTDETGEWEIISRPVSFRGGKSVRARVQVPGQPPSGLRAARLFLTTTAIASFGVVGLCVSLQRAGKSWQALRRATLSAPWTEGSQRNLHE
jgi:hypothetical protein